MPVTILYVNTPPYIGGAEVSLLTLMRHLDRSRYQPVLLTSGEGKLAKMARAGGIAIEIQEFSWPSRRFPWRYPRSVLHVALTLRRYKVSIVHTNCDRSLPYVRHACRLLQLPYISHVRDFVRSWFIGAQLAALKKARFVLANSQAMADACIAAGVEPGHLRVVNNPVELHSFAATRQLDRRELRQELGLPADAFIVGIIGQIQPIKGHMELINAAANVRKSVPQAHFVVVGEAVSPAQQTFRKQLTSAVEAHNLTDQVQFMGFREDIPRIVQALDVLAVPSWREPFGRVVVEGLAAGCPVIGTNNGGIPEIIENGKNGILIPPQDPHSLAGAIIEISTNPKLQEKLRIASWETAQRFSVGRHVAQIEGIYQQLLSTKQK